MNKDNIQKLRLDELEKVTGGLQGNLEIPEGYKRVCVYCGSENIHYWSGLGAPVCYDCWESEYNFVPN